MSDLDIDDFLDDKRAEVYDQPIKKVKCEGCSKEIELTTDEIDGCFDLTGLCTNCYDKEIGE